MLLVGTKASLSLNKRRFVELMQKINFGRIHGLLIRDSEPVLDPPPVVERDIKIGGDNGPRRELEADDFVLKKEVIDFFAELDRMGNGTVECVEIKGGLPFLIRVKESVQS